MKVVTYKAYGGYYVPKSIIASYYDIDYYDITYEIECNANKIKRNDLKLCELFEKYLYWSNTFKVNVIPDNSYYKIFEYDGYETLFYSESPIYEVE